MTFMLDPNDFPLFFSKDESVIDFQFATQPFLSRCFGVTKVRFDIVLHSSRSMLIPNWFSQERRGDRWLTSFMCVWLFRKTISNSMKECWAQYGTKPTLPNCASNSAPFCPAYLRNISNLLTLGTFIHVCFFLYHSDWNHWLLDWLLFTISKGWGSPVEDHDRYYLSFQYCHALW
jgi:hypothetical protein